jgi:hypothetical protein
MREGIRITSILMCVFVAVGAAADVLYRPKTIQEIERVLSVERVKMVHVPGSTVAWADYEALRRDFPFLKDHSRTQIDEWIIKNFSYVTDFQVRMGVLRNTLIPKGEGKQIEAYRQANYEPVHKEFQGRGAMITVNGPQGDLSGIVDVKGIGVSETKFHENESFRKAFERGELSLDEVRRKVLSNGLMEFGETGREAVVMKILQRLFDHLNASGQSQLPEPEGLRTFGGKPHLQTIEGYFVLRLPFEIYVSENQTVPAAIYGRQSHLGRVWMGKVFHSQVNIKQADFSFGLVDGETVAFRHPVFERLLKELPYLQRAEKTFDPGRLVEGAYRDDPKILHAIEEKAMEILDEVLAPRSNAPGIRLFTPEDAILFSAHMIADDPARFSRGAEAIVWAQDRGMRAVTSTAIVQDVIHKLLTLPREAPDHSGAGWMWHWGVRLLPSLAEARARQTVLAELMASRRLDKHWAEGTGAALASVAWAFTDEEIQPYLRTLALAAPEEFLGSLVRKMRQRQFFSDPKAERVQELFRWSLREPKLRKSAESHIEILPVDVQRRVLPTQNRCSRAFN